MIDVEAAGVAFPEVLQSRGLYQLKPDLPFIPGAEVSGTVRSASEGSAHRPGDRVVAMCMLGGSAEVAAAPEFLTFRLTDDLDAAQGAGLILNYHTAYFSLVTRGRLEPGRDRARARRSGRRRHGDAPGRQGAGGANVRRRLRRREGGGRAPGRRRRGVPLRRRRGRTRCARPAAPTSSSTPSAATA